MITSHKETLDSELPNNAEAIKDIAIFGDKVMPFVLRYGYESFGGRAR